MADALYPITVPKWGIEMQEGTITAWQVAPGAVVAKGDELIDIETDKIVNTVEAPVSGTVCRQLVGEGETLKVGELLGVIAIGDASEADIDAFVAAFTPADASFGIGDSDDAPVSGSAAPTDRGSTSVSEPSEPSESSATVRVSPVARRLAEQLGVDLATLTGSGRNGRISRQDVERAAAARGPAAARQDSVAATPLTGRRQTIARRLAAAKQDIPHYYVTRRIDMRAALAAKREDVSVNAIVMHAVAKAMEAEPLLNSHLGDAGLIARDTVDLNMAVDTAQGLVAPLLRDVRAMTLEALTAAARDLAARARGNALDKADLEIGGFTVSNLGTLGVDAFTAIIMPPQTGILAVGAVTETPVAANGEIVLRPQLTVTLSADHRVVDGADAARFLASLADALAPA